MEGNITYPVSRIIALKLLPLRVPWLWAKFPRKPELELFLGEASSPSDAVANTAIANPVIKLAR
jgi:hypothetical protein